MNDQQESVIEAGVRVGFRDSDPQMRTVLTSAMKSGFNVVYTVVPRSGLTHTLCNFATDGLFGTHALLFISGMPHRYHDGKLHSGEHRRDLPVLDAKFAQAPLILDMPQLADSLLQVAKMIRCHLGPIFLFTDEPCEFLQSHLTLRPTIFAHDPFAEAVEANPFPFLPYGELGGDNVLPVPQNSYIERYLISALREHKDDPARGAYLMHVLTRVLVSRGVHNIVLCNTALLSSQYIVRTLNDALPANGRVGYCGSQTELAVSLNDKVSTTHLFDSIVHDLQTYVAEI